MSKNVPKVGFFQQIKSFFTDEKVRFIIGLIILFGNLYVCISLISFLFTGSEDFNLLGTEVQIPDFDDKPYMNVCGAGGAIVANFFINKWFGISSFFLIFWGFSAGYKLVNPTKQYSLFKQLIVCVFFTIWISVALGFVLPDIEAIPYIKLGGNHGNAIAAFLSGVMGKTGLVLLLVGVILIFCIIAFVSALPAIRKWMDFSSWKRFKKKDKSITESLDNTDTTINEENLSDSKKDDDIDFTITDTMDDILESEDESDEKEELIIQPINEDDEIGFEVNQSTDEGSEIVDKPIDLLEKYGEYDPKLDLPHYKIPTFNLLKDYNLEDSIDLNEQNANKQRIIETLKTYGITIKEIKATVGPTITLYEIIPGEGVRIAKIRNLGDDIALSLAAEGIRIIAPIPGKGTIGIEVPNENKQIVPMRSVIASKKFQESTFDLPLVFGKTITNEVFMVDMCKMPHLLVAGATGQGKSVGLNAIITSLLYKKHPSQLKFVLVDPKKVEFSIYSTIEKHFLAKLPDNEEAIITNVNKVVQTLKSLCKEMDTRYDLLKKAHVRNIKEYNDKFVKRQLNPEKGHCFLPYIVVVIDEFGDLIMTAGKDVELPIARIAQLARAIGIHMIIATQRPTTNIITGTIKANFPARMAFRTAASIDSRTILDAPGADKLIGRGDMLFSQGSDLVRIQCAFVDTPEIEAICSYIGDQKGYPAAFALPEVESENGGDTDIRGIDMSQRDAMFEEAARLIVIHQSGSTSMIQRKFSIGYNRAGRLMDQLEAAGIVGPADGSKSRQVLVQDEIQLENLLATL